MATCKDCLHVDVCCSYLSTAYNKCKLATPDFEQLKNIECDECQHFKDRSRFGELPCRVGDKVYCGSFGKLMEDEIICITIDAHETRVVLKRGISYDIDKINRMFFFTHEAAEKALKEREEND